MDIIIAKKIMSFVNDFITQSGCYMDQLIEKNNIEKLKLESKEVDDTNTNSTNTNRKEVFRISPEKGKYYEYAEYTERIGVWPNVHYFTTNPLTYVGKHIQHWQEGGGDGADHWDIFENVEGKEVRIDYTYEGTTSFKEVPRRNHKIGPA